jgi:hypothetical protein
MSIEHGASITDETGAGYVPAPAPNSPPIPNIDDPSCPPAWANISPDVTWALFLAAVVALQDTAEINRRDSLKHPDPHTAAILDHRRKAFRELARAVATIQRALRGRRAA